MSGFASRISSDLRFQCLSWGPDCSLTQVLDNPTSDPSTASTRDGKGHATTDANAHLPHDISSRPPHAAVEFTVLCSPLHGISGPEVNASIMRSINAMTVDGKGRAFILGTRGPGLISATTAMQRADRWSYLKILRNDFINAHAFLSHLLSPSCVPFFPRISSLLTGDVSQPWEEMISSVVDPVMRKTFSHVHNCKCDAALLKASADK